MKVIIINLNEIIKREEELNILEMLFSPINNKDFGKFWYVSTKRKNPLKDVYELQRYIKNKNDVKHGKFINRYANLENDLILENNIYMDFDLTKKDYLLKEEANTRRVLDNLETNIKDIDNIISKLDTSKQKDKVKKAQEQVKKEYLVRIYNKKKDQYDEDSDFSKGYFGFIESLTKEEQRMISKYVEDLEAQEIKDLDEETLKQYYIKKFEKDYLKQPFKEATRVCGALKRIGIETVLNWSGSKGLHLRIPITQVDFSEYTELKDNPENVKIYLQTLAKIIEEKVLKQPVKTTSLDYQVFCKGMQRLPTSQHNKTCLYANYVDPTTPYHKAIETIEYEVPPYLPPLIDTEENTKRLLESNLHKEIIKLAGKSTKLKTYISEYANPNYEFKSDDKELIEQISKIYLPEYRNNLGYRIVHVLKRAGFRKERIEEIFRNLHGSEQDYKNTIHGSINYAFKPKARIVGLRNLTEAIKENVSPEIANEVITFFKDKFRYHLTKTNNESKPMNNTTADKDSGFRFGENVKKNNSYYIQFQKKGIVFREKKETKEEIKFLDRRVANIVIEKITIILDELKIFDPVYNIRYENLTFSKTVEKEYITFEELINDLIIAKVFHKPFKNEIQAVISSFLIDGGEKNIVDVKEIAYLKGFWILDDKVISNTKISELKYSKEELAESVKLLNEIMESRSQEGKRNDVSVYHFMLYSPFSYCLKQLGYGDNNYSLILIGASQTNKTGSIKIANHFYQHTEEETAGSTVSVLGSKIGENSFPKVFDECSHLFKLDEAENVMKKAVYEKTARATKDKSDNTKIDEFKALGLPLFILNERQEFKDFITNRYKILHYSNESIIPDEEKMKFNQKYKPKNPKTILKKLNLIGKVFSERMIKIIEDYEQHDRLFNIEVTVIEILHEIADIAGVEFLPEMYEASAPSTTYNYDVKEEIRELLNQKFKEKNRLVGDNKYSGNSFVKSIENNDFPFIFYNRERTEQQKGKEFIIDKSKLVKYINKNIDAYVEIETIIEALNLTETLRKRAEKKGKDYYDYIVKNQENFTYMGKKKNVRGFYLNTNEIISKIFSMNLNLNR